MPVARWFGKMSGQTLYPLQDPLHCAKKIRNQMDLTETHLLHLGNISLGSKVGPGVRSCLREGLRPNFLSDGLITWIGRKGI